MNTRSLLLEFKIEEVGRQARKDASVREDLLHAFQDSSEIVRERALLAAIELTDPAIVKEAKNLLDDENEDVKIAAAQVLAWYHQPRTIPNLLEGLKDSSTWVRSHCAKGLSKLLHGPIWARVEKERIDTLLADFPDMSEEEIRMFLMEIGLTSLAIDNYLRWRDEDFDIDIDVSSFVDELEGKPIILEGVSDVEAEIEAKGLAPAETRNGISKEVAKIIDELPTHVRESLPIEELRRLTPETARELVDSLKSKVPAEEEFEAETKVSLDDIQGVGPKISAGLRDAGYVSVEDLAQADPKAVSEKVNGISEQSAKDIISAAKSKLPPPKKKRVRRVRKVKTVRSKKEREALLERIPVEVREAMEPEELERLSADELEAIALSTSGMTEKPAQITTDDETTISSEEDTSRLQELTDKYGKEKADLLARIPPEMLADIPENQIEEMDLETIRSLTQAL
ncbi:MAG: HEAT repeat domain-containing protein [Promethearchaeia archaeon]